MAHEVRMPKPGQMTEECTLTTWFKGEGDPVRRGDVLFEIETDKSAMEVEAFDDGVLLRRLVEAGATVPVNTICAYVGQPGEAVPDAPAVALAARRRARGPDRGSAGRGSAACRRQRRSGVPHPPAATARLASRSARGRPASRPARARPPRHGGQRAGRPDRGARRPGGAGRPVPRLRRLPGGPRPAAAAGGAPARTTTSASP